MGHLLGGKLMPEANIRIKKHIFPVQLPHIEAVPVCQRMPRRKGEGQRFGPVFLPTQVLPFRPVGQDNGLIFPISQSCKKCFVVLRLGGDRHVRVRLSRVLKQDERRHRGAGAKGQGVAGPVFGPDQLQHIPRLVQNTDCIFGGQFPVFIELQLVLCMAEQGHPKFSF